MRSPSPCSIPPEGLRCEQCNCSEFGSPPPDHSVRDWHEALSGDRVGDVGRVVVSGDWVGRVVGRCLADQPSSPTYLTVSGVAATPVVAAQPLVESAQNTL